MKKILYIFVSVVFFIHFAYALEEIEVNNFAMPTDEEIINAIRVYNFDKDKEELLFKETKKRLKEIYQMQSLDSKEEGGLSKNKKKKLKNNRFESF